MVRQLREYHLLDGRVLNDLGHARISNRERKDAWGIPPVVLHRIAGPAVTYPSGYQAYWIHGIRHRIDGPAIIYSDSDLKPLFYLFGKRMEKEVFQDAVEKLNINLLTEYLIDPDDLLRKVAEETIKLLRAKENGTNINGAVDKKS